MTWSNEQPAGLPPHDSTTNERLDKLRAAVSKLTLEVTRTSRPRAPRLEDAPPTPSTIDPNASFHLGMELFSQDVASMERNLQERLQTLERELKEIQTIESTVSATEYDTLSQHLLFLSECSNARMLLDESLALSTPVSSEQPNLVASSQKLVACQQATQRATDVWRLASNEDDNLLTVLLDTISSEQRRQKLDLTAQAIHILTHAVTISSYALVVSASPEALSTAYNVLQTLDDPTTSLYAVTPLQATLRQWTRTWHAELLGPAVQARMPPHVTLSPRTTRIFLESDTKVGATSNQSACGRRLEWTTTPNTDTHELSAELIRRDAWKETLSFLQRILVFVADHVLLQRRDLCDMVAQRLFGKPNALPSALNLELLGVDSCRLGDDNGVLLVPLLEALDETCVPNHLPTSELGTLNATAHAMKQALDPFVNELTAKGLLPAESAARLSDFTVSLEQKYVNHRRCFLLNEARDMLLNNDYHNTVVVGEAVEPNKDDQALGIPDGMAVFKLHRASISDTAYKLMAQVRRVLDEAVEQPAVAKDSPLSLLPGTLYRTAREMLDLFRAVIPVKHGHEVATVPRTAAVLHNDGVYFSHYCLTLGLEYKEKFPEPIPDDTKGNLLRRMCVFVDMVPLFRDVADRSLGDMLDAQARELTRLVGERITLMGEALRSEEILAEWSDAETAMAAALYHLRHLSQTWKPILSADMLNRSLCYLMDVTLTLFLDQVAKASDISSSACSFVSTLFEKSSHDLQVLLGDHGTSDSREWDRFAAVGRFMDMSMADIEVALSDGLFRSVTGPELARLVTSCFDDTPKRRALLKTLSNP